MIASCRDRAPKWMLEMQPELNRRGGAGPHCYRCNFRFGDWHVAREYNAECGKAANDPPLGGSLNPIVGPGDRIQIGTELTTGEILWGSTQTVLRLSNGRPLYRPKNAKVDKIADLWRWPNGQAQRPER